MWCGEKIVEARVARGLIFPEECEESKGEWVEERERGRKGEGLVRNEEEEVRRLKRNKSTRCSFIYIYTHHQVMSAERERLRGLRWYPGDMSERSRTRGTGSSGMSPVPL